MTDRSPGFLAPRPDQVIVQDGRPTADFLRQLKQLELITNGNRPVRIPEKTVAELADYTADQWPGCSVIVTDEAGGRTIATSDGTNWRRVRDGAVVS